jgi:hypothetical protein
MSSTWETLSFRAFKSKPASVVGLAKCLAPPLPIAQTFFKVKNFFQSEKLFQSEVARVFFSK